MLREDENGVKHVTKVLLIFKYGGVLTDMGHIQADLLGKSFRQRLYDLKKTGMLSLHSACDSDVKFYASDEGRVQMTAAYFARAFLDLDEEEVIPILFALIWNDQRSNMLLEHSSSDSDLMMKIKQQINAILHTDIDFRDVSIDPNMQIAGIPFALLKRTNIDSLKNPVREMAKVRDHVYESFILLICYIIIIYFFDSLK